MLWFGYGVRVDTTNSNPFKNILCYGSAAISVKVLNLILVFKNILCYGSARRKDFNALCFSPI